MFEQTFKNIDDVLYKDAGADSELDYIGQTSWVLFLRYLDEMEKERADEAELRGQEYLDIPEPSWSYTPLGLSSSAIFMCMPSLHLAELIQTINGSGHSEKEKSSRTDKYLGSLERILSGACKHSIPNQYTGKQTMNAKLI